MNTWTFLHLHVPPRKPTRFPTLSCESISMHQQRQGSYSCTFRHPISPHIFDKAFIRSLGHSEDSLWPWLLSDHSSGLIRTSPISCLAFGIVVVRRKSLIIRAENSWQLLPSLPPVMQLATTLSRRPRYKDAHGRSWGGRSFRTHEKWMSRRASPVYLAPGQMDVARGQRENTDSSSLAGESVCDIEKGGNESHG